MGDLYKLEQTPNGWQAFRGDELLGIRPKQTAAKRLAEQTRGRQLYWTKVPGQGIYTAVDLL